MVSYSRQGLDRVPYDLRRKGLVDELDPFAFEPLDACDTAFGGDHDRGQIRQLRVSLHLVDHFLAIHDGHVNIGHNKIDPVASSRLQSFLPIAGLEDIAQIETAHTDRFNNHRPHDTAIIDDKNIEWHISTPLPYFPVHDSFR